MSKFKTRKSLLRRVKLTKSGKLLHRSNFHRHLGRNKTSAQKRRLKKLKEFSPGYANKFKKILGNI